MERWGDFHDTLIHVGVIKRPDKLMFIVIGARDFSPEITVHLIGTKVPCFDKVPPPQIPI